MMSNIDELKQYSKLVEQSISATKIEQEKMYKKLLIFDNLDEIAQNIDVQFEEMTGLSKTDFVIICIGALLHGLKSEMIKQLGQPIKREERIDHNEGDKNVDPLEKDFLEKNKHKGKAESKKRHKTWQEIIADGVPYDAIAGSAAYDLKMYGKNHRNLTLGHDPVLGWFYGTLNILTNTLTTTSFQSFNVEKVEAVGKVRTVKQNALTTPTTLSFILNDALDSVMEDPIRLKAALFKQAVHLKSDYNTKMGLPIPMLTTFLPETGKKVYKANYDLLCSARDMKNIGESFALAQFINIAIAFLHELFYDAQKDGEASFYEVRTNKVVTYSATFGTMSNLLKTSIMTAITKDKKQLSNLDVGGIGNMLFALMQNVTYMRQLKQEFLMTTFEQLFNEEADEQTMGKNDYLKGLQLKDEQIQQIADGQKGFLQTADALQAQQSLLIDTVEEMDKAIEAMPLQQQLALLCERSVHDLEKDEKSVLYMLLVQQYRAQAAVNEHQQSYMTDLKALFHELPIIEQMDYKALDYIKDVEVHKLFYYMLAEYYFLQFQQLERFDEQEAVQYLHVSNVYRERAKQMIAQTFELYGVTGFLTSFKEQLALEALQQIPVQREEIVWSRPMKLDSTQQQSYKDAIIRIEESVIFAANMHFENCQIIVASTAQIPVQNEKGANLYFKECEFIVEKARTEAAFTFQLADVTFEGCHFNGESFCYSEDKKDKIIWMHFISTQLTMAHCNISNFDTTLFTYTFGKLFITQCDFANTTGKLLEIWSAEEGSAIRDCHFEQLTGKDALEGSVYLFNNEQIMFANNKMVDCRGTMLSGIDSALTIENCEIVNADQPHDREYNPVISVQNEERPITVLSTLMKGSTGIDAYSLLGDNSMLNVKNCKFEHMIGTVLKASNVKVDNCTFEKNTDVVEGEAINGSQPLIEHVGKRKNITSTINNCTFNECDYSRSIVYSDSKHANLEVHSSTISHCTTNASILEGQLTFKNMTFTENRIGKTKTDMLQIFKDKLSLYTQNMYLPGRDDQKIDKALQHFANGLDKKRVIFVIDSTLFCRATEGYILTHHNIYFSKLKYFRKIISYKEIEKCYTKIIDGKTQLVAELTNGDTIQFYCPSTNHFMLSQFIKQMKYYVVQTS